MKTKTKTTTATPYGDQRAQLRFIRNQKRLIIRLRFAIRQLRSLKGLSDDGALARRNAAAQDAILEVQRNMAAMEENHRQVVGELNEIALAWRALALSRKNGLAPLGARI